MLKKSLVVALAGLTLSLWGALAFAAPNSLTATKAEGTINVLDDFTDAGPDGDTKCWYVLHAKGAGYAHLAGKGIVRIRALGASLLVKNFSQTEVKVRGNGIKVPFPEQDAMLYIGYGEAQVKGEAVDIYLSTVKAEIKAKGKGTAEFRGKWHYTVNRLCVNEADPTQKPKPVPIATGEVTEADGEKVVTYGEE
ncbi:MAG: hypothetical protein AB1797_09150 [bacterium]